MGSKSDNITEVWFWLCEHPAFLRVCERGRILHSHGFEAALDIDFALVNPKTCRVDGDESKNTKTECWLEAGPWRWATFSTGAAFESGTHDLDLDCGGDTFEEALLKMRDLVLKKYGDYDPEYWDTDDKYLPHLETQLASD